jgi:DNA-binding MarR family transcriptional regulator
MSVTTGNARAFDTREVSRVRLAVLRLARRIRQHANAGVTPSQLSALAAVDRYGPLGLGELAAIEAVRPPSITRVVAALEEAGLVRRGHPPGDRRAAVVGVTPAGARLLEDVRQQRDAWLAARIARLDAAETAALTAALPVLERLLEDG